MRVVKKAKDVLKKIVQDRRRNNVTGQLQADRESTATIVYFESITVPLEDHLSTGDTYARDEANTEAATSTEGTPAREEAKTEASKPVEDTAIPITLPQPTGDTEPTVQ